MFEYMQYAAIHRPAQSTRYLYMHVVKNVHMAGLYFIRRTYSRSQGQQSLETMWRCRIKDVHIDNIKI